MRDESVAPAEDTGIAHHQEDNGRSLSIKAWLLDAIGFAALQRLLIV
ncbi:MAG: hypothetical protein ACAF41_09220 [Leptolyngbya sp. BL-A-14]